MGETVTFRITVTNDGDVPLDNIVVTDANAPGCSRNPLGTDADGHGPAITLAAFTGSKTYDCQLQNVPIDFQTNLAEACADDPLDGEVCDTDTETITPQQAEPKVDTQASETIVVGNGHTISDKATLSLGYNPTGFITFELYGPDDATCGGPNLYTGGPAP